MEELVNDDGGEQSERSENGHPPVRSDGKVRHLVWKDAYCKRPNDQGGYDQPTSIQSNCEAQHFEKSDLPSEHINAPNQFPLSCYWHLLLQNGINFAACR